MSKQIWRFPLETKDKQTVKMPKDASILCVQMKDDEPCLWAEVKVEAPNEDRVIEIFGTGHDMPCDMGIARKYIGTFQVTTLANFTSVPKMVTLVWHVYERTN